VAILNPVAYTLTIMRAIASGAISDVYVRTEGGTGITSFNLTNAGNNIFNDAQSINSTTFTKKTPDKNTTLSAGNQIDLVITTVDGAVTEFTLQLIYTRA